MFIQLKDGNMLNTRWLNNVYIDEEDNNKLIFEMVNGTKIREEYNSKEEAETRKQSVYETLIG